MNVQILTRDEVVFSGEVDSIRVPGKGGSFQMMNNHAPVVSVLDKGLIELFTHNQERADFLNVSAKVVAAPNNENILHFPIEGGVLEFNNNTAIVLID